MLFPSYRPRRLRGSKALRKLVRETAVSVDDLIMPLFVRPGKGVKNEIGSMKGNYQMSVDVLVEEALELEGMGVSGVILFGIPDSKDPQATGAYAEDGIVQQAVRAIKEKVGDILVITDVCLCEYTDHGHCGHIVKDKRTGQYDVDNDATLELLKKTALSHAKAGADIVAPSDMMDGRVGAIREVLDKDIIRIIKDEFAYPVAAYSVSGEFAMVKAAAEKGWLDERDAAKWLKE
jgi:porphobilinogen synthase